MFRRIIKLCFLTLSLAIVCLVGVISFIDPNNYKGLISEKAKQKLGLNVRIENDLNWSFWPLGFEVEGLKVLDRNQDLFTSIDTLTLSVDTLSLLRLTPLINGVYSSGAKIQLAIDAHGEGNWATLLDPKKPNNARTPAKHGADNIDAIGKPQSNDNTSSIGGLLFAKNVRISDFEITLKDARNDSHLEIANINLHTENAQLGHPFPIRLDYAFKNIQSGLVVSHALAGDLELSSEMNNLRLTNFENSIDVVGLEHVKQAIKLSLTGALNYDRSKDSFTAEHVQLSGAGFAIDTQFHALNLSANPEVKGTISVAPFSLFKATQHLGLDLGMNLGVQDASFDLVSFSSPFRYKLGWFELPTFDLRVDDTRLIGRLKSHPAQRIYDLSLKGDTLTIDNYLTALRPTPSTLHRQNNVSAANLNHAVTALGHQPVASTSSITPARLTQTLGAVSSSPAQTNAPAILPLALLRDLQLSIDLKQDALSYKGISAHDITLSLKIDEGQVVLDTLSGKVFKGAIDAKAAIDLRTDSPIWNGELKAMSLDVEEILAKLNIDTQNYAVSGALHTALSMRTQGNTYPTMLANAKGVSTIAIDDGAVTGLDVDDLLCQGISLLNQEEFDKSQDTSAAKTTHFSRLSSQHTLANQELTSTELTIISDSVEAQGQGAFNLDSQQYAYDLQLKPKSHAQINSCRINKKLSNLSIPVRCAGSTLNNEHTCSLNRDALTKQLRALAKQEATRKLEKEVDRALTKKLDRYLDKDSKAAQELKKGLMNLFR